jgi:Resolvase, N terminal domain
LESGAPRCSSRPSPAARTGPAPEVRYERAACRVRPMLHRSTRSHCSTRRLLAMGVEPERVYVYHGLTGTNRERPGLREALAACRAGDTLVVTKLDRLARSLPDARAIADELTTRQISLSLGGSVYDPTDAVGRLLFNVLAMVAEFESDLIRLRTREGMKVAKGQGPVAGQAAQAQPSPGSAPRIACAQRRVQHRRGGRPVRCRPLHRLPHYRTPTHRCQGRPRGSNIETLTPDRAGVPHPTPPRDAGGQ